MRAERVNGLERVKDQVTRCNSCTECYGRGPLIPYADSVDSVPSWICPIVDQFKFVTYTARSQQALARGVAYGHLAAGGEHQEGVLQLYDVRRLRYHLPASPRRYRPCYA